MTLAINAVYHGFKVLQAHGSLTVAKVKKR